MPVSAEQMQAQLKKVQKSDRDTGSSEVQVVRLTSKIENLSAHFEKNVKDHLGRLGLLKFVGQRRRLLKYLKRKDKESYKKVILELGIRK